MISSSNSYSLQADSKNDKTEKILQNIDNFIMLKDTIKNYRRLTAEQIQYVYTLSDKQKIDIIILYNKIIATLEHL